MRKSIYITSNFNNIMKQELSTLFGKHEIKTRSVANILLACEKLSISEEKAQSIIAPQDVHIFRLPVNVLGKTMQVWGCTSFHNKARGVYKGGIRISDDVDIAETIELSRLMTLKTALTEIEFGGAKTGINFDMGLAYSLFGRYGYDPEFESSIKRAILKEYAHHYRGMLSKHRYVPAPDMNTGPREMAVIYDETHEPSSVTGKPEGISGWLPGRVEATGYGVAMIVKYILSYGGLKEGFTVAVQGFGNVGSFAARFISELGGKIVAVSDKYCSIHDPKGIDTERLSDHVKKTGSIKGFGNVIDDLFSVDCDVLVPAAINDAIDSDTAKRVRAKYIVEGANFAVTASGMDVLNSKGVIVYPDIIANSGGVIASSKEYLHPVSTEKVTKEDVFRIIESKMIRNLELASDLSKKHSVSLDAGCTMLAVKRVYDTMSHHGWI